MRKITLVAVLLCATNLLFSQETIPASGGDAMGTGGSSSYSVGQLVYSTNSDATGTVSQGVQQSIEIFVLSNPDLETVTLKAVTYPNPTINHVVLELSDANITNLTYLLFDIHGRVVSNGTICQKQTQIQMQNLESGTYILNVNQNNKALKTFKIIKN